MNRLLKLFCAIYLLSSFFCASAQEIREYAFTRFSTSNGLLSNTIHSTVQDIDGFIWLAGSNGLQRYDGNNFLNFKAQKGVEGSLPSDDLVRLHMDKFFRLWVISRDNQIGIFNTHTLKYNPVKLELRMPRNLFGGISFFETNSGKIYYNEPSGALYRYDNIKNAFVSADADMPKPPIWSRFAASFDSETNMLWMLGDSGVAMYNLNTKHLNYKGHNPDNDPVIKSIENEKTVIGVQPLKGAYVYFVSWPATSGVPNLIAINKATGEQKRTRLNEKIRVTYHEIGTVFRQRNGRVWTCGKSFLAEIINGGDKVIEVPNEFKHEQSIRFDKSTSIFEDRAGNIWFGTDNGLYLFNPDDQPFHLYKVQRPNGKPSYEAAVQTILQTDKGNYFVGTWGQGLFYFDKDFKPIELPKVLQEKMDVLSIWDMHKHSRTGN